MAVVPVVEVGDFYHDLRWSSRNETAGGEAVSTGQRTMPLACALSGRVIADRDSLPARRRVLADGASESGVHCHTAGQAADGSPKRDPPAAPSHDTGSEERHAASSVEPGSNGGRLPQTSLRRVLEHMQANLDQELSVTALAAVAQISPFYFSRLFKQSTGLSPHQYLLRQRILRAQELLADPSRRVAEVSYELGFPHQSHFTTVFGKLVGMTPRAYQRQRTGQ
jgi:AraC-like DNA-binding protein